MDDRENITSDEYVELLFRRTKDDIMSPDRDKLLFLSTAYCPFTSSTGIWKEIEELLKKEVIK